MQLYSNPLKNRNTAQNTLSTALSRCDVEADMLSLLSERGRGVAFGLGVEEPCILLSFSRVCKAVLLSGDAVMAEYFFETADWCTVEYFCVVVVSWFFVVSSECVPISVLEDTACAGVMFAGLLAE